MTAPFRSNTGTVSSMLSKLWSIGRHLSDGDHQTKAGPSRYPLEDRDNGENAAERNSDRILDVEGPDGRGQSASPGRLGVEDSFERIEGTGAVVGGEKENEAEAVGAEDEVVGGGYPPSPPPPLAGAAEVAKTASEEFRRDGDASEGEGGVEVALEGPIATDASVAVDPPPHDDNDGVRAPSATRPREGATELRAWKERRMQLLRRFMEKRVIDRSWSPSTTVDEDGWGSHDGSDSDSELESDSERGSDDGSEEEWAHATPDPSFRPMIPLTATQI